MGCVNPNAEARRLSLEEADAPDTWKLVGELDSHSADLVAGTVGTADPGTNLTLEMSGVSFIDSTGLRALVELRTGLVESGGSLAIDQPSDAVRRVIELTGLAEHLGIE
jgi:anti-sigma B factor antagonist